MANVLFSMNGDITSGDGGSVVDFLTFNSMSPAGFSLFFFFFILIINRLFFCLFVCLSSCYFLGNFNISLYYEGDYQNTNDGVVFLFSDNCFQDFDEVQIDVFFLFHFFLFSTSNPFLPPRPKYK